MAHFTQIVDSGGELNNLTDVAITTPALNEVLQYDGNDWVNGTIPITVALDDLTDVVITTPVLNEVLQYDGNDWVNGTISTAAELDDLTDVVITTPVLNEVLQYDGNDWVNGTIAASALDNLSDVVITSPSTNNFLRYNGSNWVNAASGGLYGSLLSTVPTAANTGLSSWGNQNGAVATDGETGIVVTGSTSANDISIRYGAAPSTPYTITALIATNQLINSATAFGVVFGWYDGTKIQAFIIYGATPYTFDVLDYPNLTSAGAASGTPFIGNLRDGEAWVQLKDDGTTVTYYYLPQGNAAARVSLYSVAKSAGYLGSSGYSNICFGVNRRDSVSYSSLLSYSVGP